MAGTGDGPDKRTTAYENIFGRPHAKPKGPVAQSPSSLPPAGFPVYPYPHPVQQQCWQQQSQARQQQPRWNGTGPANTVVAVGYGLNGQASYGLGGGYYRPNNSYPHEQLDRRSSVTPSFNSRLTSSSGYPATPYTRSSSTAESYYGGVKGPTPASAYANFHSNSHSAEAPSPTPSVAPTLPYLHRVSIQSDGHSDPLPSFSSSTTESVYGRELPGSGSNGCAGASMASFHTSVSPQVQRPRLPSFELDNQGNGVDEANWFKGISLDGTAASSSGVQHSNGTAQSDSSSSASREGMYSMGSRQPESLIAPHEKEDENEDNFATPGPTDGRYHFASGKQHRGYGEKLVRAESNVSSSSVPSFLFLRRRQSLRTSSARVQEGSRHHSHLASLFGSANPDVRSQ